MRHRKRNTENGLVFNDIITVIEEWLYSDIIGNTGVRTVKGQGSNRQRVEEAAKRPPLRNNPLVYDLMVCSTQLTMKTHSVAHCDTWASILSTLFCTTRRCSSE